jgi:hypothetical protein
MKMMTMMMMIIIIVILIIDIYSKDLCNNLFIEINSIKLGEQTILGKGIRYKETGTK